MGAIGRLQQVRPGRQVFQPRRRLRGRSAELRRSPPPGPEFAEEPGRNARNGRWNETRAAGEGAEGVALPPARRGGDQAGERGWAARRRGGARGRSPAIAGPGAAETPGGHPGAAGGRPRPRALTPVCRFPALLRLPARPGGAEPSLSPTSTTSGWKPSPSPGWGAPRCAPGRTRTAAGRAVPFPEAATEDTRSGSRKQELPALLPDPPPLSLSSPPRHRPLRFFPRPPASVELSLLGEPGRKGRPVTDSAGTP